MPNTTGGRGVPKYVRQTAGTVENENGSYFNGWWTEPDSTGVVENQQTETSSPSPDENINESNQIIRADVGTLSASAVEFRPKVPESAPTNNGKVSYAAAAAKIASTV